MAIVKDDQLDEHLHNSAMAEAFAAAGLKPEEPVEVDAPVILEDEVLVPSETTTTLTNRTEALKEPVVSNATSAPVEPTVVTRVSPKPTTPPTKNTRNKETTMANQKGNTYQTYSLFSQSPVQRTLNLSSGAVDANELRKKFVEIIETDSTVNVGLYGEPKFFVLDAVSVGITFNALVVLQAGAAGDKPTYFTMLMEPNEPLPSRPVKYNNHSVNLQSVMSEAYTNDIAQRIARYMASVTSSNVDNVVEAGWSVIPRGFDIRSDKAAENVRPALFYALNATNTAIDEDSEYPRRLELTAEKGIRKQLNLSSNFNGEEVETGTGLPVRSDVTLTTTLQVRDEKDELVVVGGNAGISRLSGFVDLFYAPDGSIPNQPTQPNEYMSNRMSDAWWAPRFVITRNQPLTNQIGIGEILLGLSTASFMGQDYNWTRDFLPGRAGTGLRDIGALGYERAFGDRLGKIDTTDPKFDLYDFLSTCVVNQLYFAWDIPEAGDMSWVENIFVQAANGDVNANEYILDAADVLTGNRYRPALAALGLDSMFTGEVIRVHLGTVPGEDGKDVDMRIVDHLSILNLTGKNGPHVAQKWTDNAVMFGRDEVGALYNRQEVIEEIYPNARFTDYAARIGLDGPAIMALADCIAAAGVTCVSNISSDPIGSRRYDQSYTSRAVGPNARSGMFVGGYRGGNGGQTLDRVRTTSVYDR